MTPDLSALRERLEKMADLETMAVDCYPSGAVHIYRHKAWWRKALSFFLCALHPTQEGEGG